MPRGYRCIVIAAFGWISLTAQHPNPPAKTNEAHANNRVGEALASIAATYDKQAKRAEGSHDGDQCQQGDDKRYSDLCAQWKAADAAADSAWWAAIGGFASAVSTILVLIALYLAFRSNGIARDTAKRQLRAYVALKQANLQQVCTVGMRPQIIATIQNTGQTPAHQLRIDSDVVLRESDFDGGYVSNIPLNYGTHTLGAGLELNVRGVLESPLSDEDVQALATGVKRIFFLAYGEYLDVFNAKQTFRIASYAMSPVHNHDVTASNLGNVWS